MNNNFRVYLRALEPEDYRISIKWRNDEEICNKIVGTRYFVSSIREKKWVEDGILDNQKNIKLAICLKENHRYIGNIYLTDIDYKNRSASYGIIIGEKDCWGKGIAKEAIFIILHYAFMELGLMRIQARYLIDNKSSINAAKKIGFKEEGILRKAVFKNGKFKDMKVMSILRNEFDETYNIK